MPTVSNVTATRQSDSVILLDFDISGWDTVGIERWSNVTDSWTRLDTYEGSVFLPYRDDRAAANRRFRYRVIANKSGVGTDTGYSNYVQTTPAAPSNISAGQSARGVMVSWKNNATTSNGYVYSTILEKSANGGPWTAVATIGGGTSSYEITSGLTPGATYQFRVAARSTVGDTTTSGYSTSGNVQIKALPPAPTGLSVTYNSDNQATLAWTNNPSAEGPYEAIAVQRWSNTANAWTTVGTLGGTATSLVDTGLVVDTRYQWRVRAENTSGGSAWVTSSFIQTKPDTPTGLTVTRGSSGAFVLTWTNAVSYSDYTTKVRYYQDGALVTDTISLAPGVTSWTLDSVTLTSNYKFGVKAVSTVGATTESAWTETPTISGSSVPSQPANLAPNGKVIDLARPQTLTWAHVPTDGASQAAYEWQHREQGTATWTTSGKITGTAQSHTIPAGTLANGKTWEWQVRTWGVNATASPWSATATFTGSTTPTIAVNEPSSAVLPTSKLVVDWNYADAEGTPQSRWEIRLLDTNGDLLEERSGNDTTEYVEMATVIENGAEYTLTLRARDGSGLWSDLKTLELVADFVKPAESELSADYDSDNGVAILTLTPGTPIAPGTESRRNLSKNARALYGSDWGEWLSRFSWSRAFVTDITDHPDGIASAARFTCPSEQVGATTRGWDCYGNTDTAPSTTTTSDYFDQPVTAGQTYTLSTWVRSSVASTFRAEARAHDGAGTWVAAKVTGPEVSVEANTWTRLSVTVTVAAGGTHLCAGFRNTVATTFPAGATIEGTGLLVERASSVSDFFDGSSARTDTHYYEWSGTAGNSASIERFIGTLAATKATIQRRLRNDDGVMGQWETLALDIAIDATVIDPMSPIAGDGEYRVVTYSDAPSLAAGAPVAPEPEERWLFVSGGPEFTQVCRMYGNITINSTASRDRAIYHFAGRKKPVLFVGDATETSVTITGVLDEESTPPMAWERLVKTSGVVLLRDPLGRRIFGSIESVNLDRIDPELTSIAFTVREVSYP